VLLERLGQLKIAVTSSEIKSDCSIVPQPATVPRAPKLMKHKRKAQEKHDKKWSVCVYISMLEDILLKNNKMVGACLIMNQERISKDV
jgi:hypothetical protein